MTCMAVSIPEAAASIGVSRGSVYRLINEGKLTAIKIRNRRLVKTDSIRALVDQAA